MKWRWLTTCSPAEDEVVVAAKEGFTPLFELLEIKDEDVRAKATMTLSILGTAPWRAVPVRPLSGR